MACKVARRSLCGIAFILFTAFLFRHYNVSAGAMQCPACSANAEILSYSAVVTKINCKSSLSMSTPQSSMHCRIAAADAVGYRQNTRHIRYLFRCFFLFEESVHACPHLFYRLLFFRIVQCPCKQTAAQKRCHAQNRTLQVELHHLRHLPEQQKLTVQIPQQNR